MNSPKLPLGRLSRILAILISAVSVFAPHASALVGPPADSFKVVYDPNTTETIEGEQPFAWTYPVKITSPLALPATATTVTLTLKVISAPAGVSDQVAASLVSFSRPSITFNGPAEGQVVNVLFNVPVGIAAGDFSFLITTPGWPEGFVDRGTYVNMHTNPPSGLTPPEVEITAPASGATYSHVLGEDPVPVYIRVVGIASPEAQLQTLTATISGVDAAGQIVLSETDVPLAFAGLGTPAGSGEVTMPFAAPGTYTIIAHATNAAGASTTSATFVVNETIPPPTVVITQPPSATYDYVLGSAALQIPFIFQGHSFEGGIRTLSATVNGVPVAVTSTNLGQLVATGTATLSLATGGEYVVDVFATDDHGNATASTSFTINVITLPATMPVRGTVFFDLNGDGVRNGDDFGLPGIVVTAVDSAGLVTHTNSTGDGLYLFNLAPGTYRVSTQLPRGFQLTTSNSRSVTIATAAITVADIGYTLCFADLKTMCANGYTIGFWKNNIDKALAGRTNGVQVSAATLRAYTATIGMLALAPFDNLTMQQATATMGSNSSKPKDLLAKQLLASEYNYANGAFLGGNGVLTYAFIYFGEYVLKNSSSFSSTYLLWVKDWFDAYNNSHGGLVSGPAPTSGGSKCATPSSRDRDSGCDSDRNTRDGDDDREGSRDRHDDDKACGSRGH